MRVHVQARQPILGGRQGVEYALLGEAVADLRPAIIARGIGEI
jgi:hypothetical protein